ncbi:hypothetical protein [Streptomyces sp. NPDC051992]|uniref:hypothetical protein n=1 Tax=Streptomyces sp. NPDC051992 TaxID=3161012 RepID=UPI00343AFAD2
MPVTTGRADSAYNAAACRQKACGRRAAGRAAEPVPDLPTTLPPFVTTSFFGISPPRYRALYRLHVAHLRGRGLEDPVAKLSTMNPDGLKIPDTADGHRLRTALHHIRQT